ncbi:MAG TPA: hypothetical protein VH481_06580 [Nitrososphaeraceae archaeon]|jgi:hypothetical protein
MSSEFVIKRRPKESEAIIFLGKDKIAKIKKHEGFTFRLISYKDKQEWVLSNLVHGQRRPFSYSVLKAIQKTSSDGRKEIQAGEEVFVVREQLFKHNGKFYMLASHPEGKSWMDYVNSSTRYVSRLDSFPYSNLSDIDHEHYKLRHKIKRFRGKSVGEAAGLGQDEGGHRLRLDNELADIGLFIAAISYLLYASG